jgi:hypothetical protein
LFVVRSRATIALHAAKSRDSSSLLFKAMARTKSGSAPMACADAAFSRAATAAAVRLFAKFRK